MTRINSLTFTLSLLALLVGCGDPPSPEEVRQRTSSIATPLIKDTAAAIESLSEHEMLGKLFGSLGDLFGGGEDISPAAPEGYSGTETDVEIEVQQHNNDVTGDADELASDLDEFLGEIFNDKNIETEDGGTTTFLISGETLCGSHKIGKTPTQVSGGAQYDSDSEAIPAASEYEDDQNDVVGSCDLDSLELRIDASLVGDGIDLGFRLGDTPGAFLELQLRPGSAKAIVYLPALKKAARDVAALIGEELPAWFPTTLDGIVSASIRKDGDALAAELAIEDALVIKGKVEGENYGADLPAARPLLSLRFEDEALSADINWGAAAAILPAKAIFGDDLIKPLTESLRLVLSGVRAKIKATADGKLDLQQVSFGKASELLLGKASVARLAFNTETMSMKVRPWNDLPRCEISPRLALELELNAAKLDPYMSSTSPSWANETYKLSFEGDANGAPVFVPLDIRFGSASSTDPACFPDTDFPNTDCGYEPEPESKALLQMLRGTLMLESINTPRKIKVDAGQCLVSVSGADEPLDGVAAGSCQ